VIEADVHEESHSVDDVWLLEIDEHGRLVREKLPAVQARWETDGPLYRSERRWEDLEALRAEARSSALDLIILWVPETRPGILSKRFARRDRIRRDAARPL
jgi:hypothetical protein